MFLYIFWKQTLSHLRITASLTAWAGFIWLLHANLRNTQVSENIWINAAYNIGGVIFAVVAALAAIALANRRFQPHPVILAIIGLVVVGVLASADVFWLRDMLTQP